MATCRKCKSFFIGAECPFCRAERMNNPEIEQKEREAAQRAERIAEDIATFKSQWASSFLISTTPLLDGYRIDKYISTVTGSTVLGTGFASEFKAGFSDLFGTESVAFSGKMDEAKDAALAKAKDKALTLGANALIGVDIGYQVFFGNMIAVIVSGTAVFIEKVSG